MMGIKLKYILYIFIYNFYNLIYSVILVLKYVIVFSLGKIGTSIALIFLRIRNAPSV